MTDKSQTARIRDISHLPQREREALADIKNWSGHTYVWKQASMKKLEARGLVRSVGIRGDLMMWEVTDEGKAHP